MKKKKMDNLKASELRYRKLFETAQDGILLIDFDTGMILDANKFLIDMLGYSKADFLKKKLWEIGFFKDAFASKANFRELQRRKYVRFEDLPLEARGGRKINVEFVSNVYDVAGTKTIQCNIRDITERRKAEEKLKESGDKYRLLIENLPQKIFFKNRKSVYIYCNENYARDLKIKASNIVGRNDYEFYPKKLADKYRADDNRIMDSGKIEDIRERYMQGGQEIWVHTVKDKSGKIRGILGIFWDITKIKKTEIELEREIKLLEKSEKATYNIMEDLNIANKNLEKEKKSVEMKVRERTLELQEAYEKLKELDRAKEEFISMLSHELKTPIFPIMGYTDMLISGSMGNVTEKQKEKLKIIAKNAAGLSRLVSDMLDMSKLELKRMKIELSQEDIRDIAKEVVDTLGLIGKSKNIGIMLNAPEKIKVSCDRKRILQVMNNLLTNAIKFSKEGGKIEITVSKDADNAKVSVKDKGLGISKDDQKQLFSRFFQVTKGTSREYGGGTGLGLAISRGIVEMHHGKIWLESAPGKGSTFTFTLPLHQKP